jgi:amino acid adenylation domain-containing protein
MVVQNFRKTGPGVPGEKTSTRVEILPLADENSPPIIYKNPTAKFDVTFFINEVGEDIYIRIEYYTGIFKEETIKRLASHFKNVVKAVGRDPSLQLKDIDIVSEEEKQQLIYEFNDTRMDYPADKTIHELFAEQAERTPDNLALHGCMTAWLHRVGHITYGELNKKSSQLARYLYEAKGIQPEGRVGILLSQSFNRPIAILGVLKAGAAYVPIDPTLPKERIKYMIIDASVGIVISEKKYLNDLNSLQWECKNFHSYLCVDSSDSHKEDEAETNELMDQELWRHVGETATDDITGGGWISSYTGEPFTKKEMDEYGDNILEKLEPLLHPEMRILEIGCASGISMYRIAPKVGFYYGTDLSAVIIEKNKKRIEEENRQNLKLACLAAHEIDNLEERNFHLVIMNSVIQCFHGHNYLRKVICKSIDLLADEGYLFLGDIMDLEKKEPMIRELQDFKYSNRDKGFTTKTDFSTELFLSRGYWNHLETEFEEIQSIESSNKIHTRENELTKFRYDVIVKINKKPVEKKKRQKQKHQDDLQLLSGFDSDLPALNLESHSLAYLIYTSGTSGQPKGVMIEHSSLVNLCYWHNSYYQVSEFDHATLYAGFGFDASVWELFPYLLAGASLYIVPDSMKLDIEKLFDYSKQHQINISFLPTQFCEQFLSMETVNSTLRMLLTGGDKLHTFVNRDYALYNNYGPTENTVVTTACLVEEQRDNIPIGKPVANTNVYILDRETLQLKPVGVPGELCIGGVGLARGYLNKQELTSSKFQIPNYMSYMSHLSYIYRTGDLARWLSDGNIEFLGRIDQQVKIRGFRIELGEIENQLLELEGIKAAVAVDRLDESGQKYLYGYFVSEQAIDPSDLKTGLSKRLPDYMIPGYFIQIESIPLNPSGKVDRKALPSLAIQRSGEYASPRDAIEKKLVR